MTQSARTIIPGVWIFIALLSFVSGLVMPYLEGLSNSLWVVPPMLPASIVPFLALFVSSIALAWCCIRSLLTNRSLLAVSVMLALAVVMFGTSIILRQSYLFHRGFRNYAKTVLTADEWRSISRLAQERLGPEGKLPGPDKNLWDEKEDRALWSDLCAATQIRKLDPSLMICVRPEKTEVVWGGALTGHRGIIIFTGKDGAEQRGGLSIADDITTFISAD